MRCGVLLMMMAAGTFSTMAADVKAGPVNVKALVHDYANLPELLLTGALGEAAGVFRKAGIELAWCVDPAVRNQCLAGVGQSGRSVLVLNLLSGVMAGRVPMDPNHFGFAGTGTAYIHISRVEDLARAGGFAVNKVLGHIIAHELGHLLLGFNAHAQSGIMSALLGKTEMAKAHRGQLWFSPAEAQHMRGRFRAARGNER